MDWIKKEAESRVRQRRQAQAIERGAPTLWQNLCKAIEQAVSCYEKTEDAKPTHFSGCANHVIWVAIFENEKRTTETGRVTITYYPERQRIEFKTKASPRAFNIGTNSQEQACLKEGDGEVSVDAFTEIALRDLFFGGPEPVQLWT